MEVCKDINADIDNKIRNLIDDLNNYTKLYDEGKFTNQEWDNNI